MKFVQRSLVILFGIFSMSFLAKGVGDSLSSPPSTKPSQCRPEVIQVLEATIGRGPPYMVQILQNDPQHADLITAESHGDHHLACTYRILMNSKNYRYRVEFPNTLRRLQEADCGTRETKKKVSEEIRHFTQDCTHPNANPHFGYPLKPEP